MSDVDPDAPVGGELSSHPLRKEAWAFARLVVAGMLLFALLTLWISVPDLVRLHAAPRIALFVVLPLLIMVAMDARERARTGRVTGTYDALIIVADLIRACYRPKTLWGALAASGAAMLLVPGWWHTIERNANTINALATTIYCVLTFYLVLIGVLSIQATIEASRRRDAPEAMGTAERPLTWRGLLGDVLRLLARRERQ